MKYACITSTAFTLAHLLLLSTIANQTVALRLARSGARLSPGGDGNPAHFEMIEARTPTTGSEAPSDAARTSSG